MAQNLVSFCILGSPCQISLQASFATHFSIFRRPAPLLCRLSSFVVTRCKCRSCAVTREKNSKSPLTNSLGGGMRAAGQCAPVEAVFCIQGFRLVRATQFVTAPKPEARARESSKNPSLTLRVTMIQSPQSGKVKGPASASTYIDSARANAQNGGFSPSFWSVLAECSVARGY